MYGGGTTEVRRRDGGRGAEAGKMIEAGQTIEAAQMIEVRNGC
jgi:hypothetical protein